MVHRFDSHGGSEPGAPELIKVTAQEDFLLAKSRLLSPFFVAFFEESQSQAPNERLVAHLLESRFWDV